MHKIILILFFVHLSCMTRSMNPSTNSNVKWAHWQPEVLGSGIMGIVESKKNKLFNQKIKVCVENNVESLTNQQFELEVKLAYSAWLSAAGYDETVWNYFQFDSSSSCVIENSNYSALAITLAPNDSRVNQHFDFFESYTLRFPIDQDFAALNSYATGSTGVLTTKTINELSEIVIDKPSYSAFSPFVQWLSLLQILSHDSNVNNECKNELILNYNNLSKQQDIQFVELQSYNTLLKKCQLIAKGQYTLGEVKERVIQEMNDRQINPTQTNPHIEPYLPWVGLFPVILHEVGHQFGMDHADSPGVTCITGSGTSINTEGQFKTLSSVMAYADQYTYLTQDDVDGINHALISLKQKH